MAIGFDYGTANCSVAHLVNKKVQQIPLIGDEYYIPSTLSAPTAEAVSEYLFRCLNIKPTNPVGRQVLDRAIKLNRLEGIDVHHDGLHFGHEALDLYLEDPKDIYYIKSPKSFLGVMGLRDMQLAFFEDLVCAMMTNIKQHAESRINKDITETVIGRPVNFKGRGGEDSNSQAEGILRNAAHRAGFKHVEFQFEPIAAGLDYESSLDLEKNVLVVDIGGGTTDCSLIRMGPKWSGQSERKETLLAHTGELVGGNDLDIFIAYKQLMPEFGINSLRKSGLPMPVTQFWNLVAINDIQAQRQFYAQDNLPELNTLYKEAKEPELINRLRQVLQDRLGYGLIREAETAKIQLGEQATYNALINLPTEQFKVSISRQQMQEAIATPLKKIQLLVKDAITQGQCQPDVVYTTGGSARSPILRNAIKTILPETEIVSGNYFGSVTSGLARWADLCYR